MLGANAARVWIGRPSAGSHAGASQVKLGFVTGEVAAIEKAAKLGFSCVVECSALGDPRSGSLDPGT